MREVAGVALERMNRGHPWKLLARKEEEDLENDERMMDSRKETCAGEEDDETNLRVEAEFTEDEKRGRKSSPNIHRKRDAKLQR
jgi:hypothetical protein